MNGGVRPSPSAAELDAGNAFTRPEATPTLRGIDGPGDHQGVPRRDPAVPDSGRGHHGGAPELHPKFRRVVSEARAQGARVIDRCNLTILIAPAFEDLPEFLAEHQVEVVASLPCYLADNTDFQRGVGVFDRSIAALRRLNAVGYGRDASGLDLTLVYNPIGPKPPPKKSSLESAYRRELRARYGLEFTRRRMITNIADQSVPREPPGFG